MYKILISVELFHDSPNLLSTEAFFILLQPKPPNLYSSGLGIFKLILLTKALSSVLFLLFVLSSLAQSR